MVQFVVSGFEVSGDNPIDADEPQRILGEYVGLDGLLAVVDAPDGAVGECTAQ